MATEAQRRALNNYRKKTKSVVVRFYPNDADEAMYAWFAPTWRKAPNSPQGVAANQQNGDNPANEKERRPISVLSRRILDEPPTTCARTILRGPHSRGLFALNGDPCDGNV